MRSSTASLLLWVAVRPALGDEGPVVRLDLAPDQRKYDPADESLRDAAFLLQKALNAEQVQVNRSEALCLASFWHIWCRQGSYGSANSLMPLKPTGCRY